MITNRRLSGAVALGLSVALTGAFATPVFAHDHLPDGEPAVVTENVTTAELPTDVQGDPGVNGAQLVRYDDGTTVLKFTDEDSQNPHEVIVDLGDNDAFDTSDTVEAEYVTVDPGNFNPVTVYQLTATDRSSEGKNGVAIGDAVVSTFHTFYENERTTDTVNFFDDEKVRDIWLYEDEHEVIEFDHEGYVRSTKIVHTDEGTRVTEYVGDAPWIPYRTKSTFTAARTGNVTITEYGEDGLTITKRTTIGGRTGNATVTEYDTNGTTVTEYDGAVAEENLIRTTVTEFDEDAKTTTQTRTGYMVNTQTVDVYGNLFDSDVPKDALPDTRTITDFGPDGVLGGEDDIVRNYVQEGGQLVLVGEEDPTPSPEPTKNPTPSPEPTKNPTPSPEPTKNPTPSPEPTKDPETSSEPGTPADGENPEAPRPVELKDNEPGSAFYAPVQWMVENSITAGYANGTFGKTDHVTRGQTAAFLYRYMKDPSWGEAQGPSAFADVDEDGANFSAIDWMYSEGMTTGYADGTFKQSRPVTRGEFAAFLYRLQDPEHIAPEVSPFEDLKVGGANYDAITWLSSEGITVGTKSGTFAQSSPITRGEISAFLQRYDASVGSK